MPASSDAAIRGRLIVRNGRVLDPANGIDGRYDLVIDDGRITAIDPPSATAAHPDADGAGAGDSNDTVALDASGLVVMPGLVDLHVHAFGALGFSDTDSIGVCSGVTTMCDAGGAGAFSYADFAAQVLGQTATDLYSWLYIAPSGIATSLVFEEQADDIRRVVPELPITAMLDLVAEHRQSIAGMKVPAFGPTGTVQAMQLAKGLAGVLGIPLYVHVGDIQEDEPPPLDVDGILDLLGPDDVVTHCYTPNPNSLLDDDGALRAATGAAVERGVGFDLGMGAFNFDFDVARRCLDAGFVPSTLSSDLQQANVTGPTHSLLHVMSMFLALGMTLEEIVPLVTANAAARLHAADRHGAIAVGRAADLTIVDVVDRPVEFRDTVGGRLPGSTALEVRHTIKDGRIIEPDLARAVVETNWSMQTAIDEDDVPSTVEQLGDDPELFTRAADRLGAIHGWTPRAAFDAIRAAQDDTELDLGTSGRRLLAAFMNPVFPQSPGYFMATQDPTFAVERLRAAASLVGRSSSTSTSTASSRIAATRTAS